MLFDPSREPQKATFTSFSLHTSNKIDTTPQLTGRQFRDRSPLMIQTNDPVQILLQPVLERQKQSAGGRILPTIHRSTI